MQIDPIAAVSLLVAAAALIFSIVSFRRSEQLNTQVALQTHLAEQKNAVKKIWHESKSVIAQIDDILERRPCVFDLENLISMSFKTHNAIHYGTADLIPRGPAKRTKNDTCPWR